MSERNEQFEGAIDWLEKRRRLLLMSHIRPDGDALGCLAATSRILRRIGKEADVVLFEACPGRYESLLTEAPCSLWPSVRERIEKAWDALVILDTCAWNQLEPAADTLRKTALDILVLDHHATTDTIGQVRVIDPTASSACLLTAELTRTASWPLDGRAASALFTGMATDTGWFRFSNVDSRTLEMAGWLTERGARPNELYEGLYLNEPAARIRLLGEMLSSLEFFDDGKLVAATLSRASFVRSGATPAMTEDLINEPQRINSVVVAVLFVEQDDGVIRASFRSKREVNVAVLAQRFGGGGHERASGARVPGPLQDVKARILGEVRRAMAAGGTHPSS